jgi:hypothetical protein
MVAATAGEVASALIALLGSAFGSGLGQCRPAGTAAGSGSATIELRHWEVRLGTHRLSCAIK